MIWSDSNLFIDDSVSSLSNCPLDGETELIIKENGEWKRKTIKECYESNMQYIITLDKEEKEIRCKINHFDVPIEYEIILENNALIRTTSNHLNKVKNGMTIPTSSLTVEDSLPYKLPFGEDNFKWIKINKIEKIENGSKDSYCLQVLENVEPLFTLANGIITHNCRLKSDITELYFNSIGGTALKVGSVKVSTVNLARLALDTNTVDEFMEELKKRTTLNLKVLDRVRYILKRNVDKGLLPNFSYGLVDFEHLYNTIGIIGNYEAIKKFGFTTKDEFGNVFYTEEAFSFGKRLFDTIRQVIDEFVADEGIDYKINIEQIPGESAASKLMKKDKFFYPNANIYELPLYGNQFIPLGIQTTLQERIKIASAFDGYCSGGSILHANIDAPFDNFEKAWDTVNYIADQGVTYFAFNTKIQACKNNHAFYGTTCPTCGCPVDTEYTRIVGFYTPIRTWSQERKNEYQLRKWENVSK